MKRILSIEFALVIALGIFWGLNWPAVKTLLTELPPWTLRSLGLGFGTIGLAALAVAMGQSLRPRQEELMQLIVAGLLSILGFNMLTAFGQLLTETSSAVIVAFTMPMWAALFSVFFLNEAFSKVRAFALLVGMAGLGVLVYGDISKFMASPSGPLFMLGAALSWAAGTVVLKAREWSVGPVARATWMVAVSVPPTVIGAFLLETPLQQPALSSSIIWVLVYHIVFPMVVCHAVWVNLVGRLPATVAALGSLLIPVVGVASSVLLLGDALTISKLLALILVLTSVALTFVKFGASSR